MASAENSPSFNVEARSDLDYNYRDVFQAFVGQGEVVLEFGNISRATRNEITISDRIVLSLPSAVRLTQHLSEQLQRARDQMQAQQEQQQPAAAAT